MTADAPTLDFLIELAIDAGHRILGDGRKTKEVNEKQSLSDIVTATDVAVEQLIRDRVRERFLNHKFMGEETSFGESSELTDAPTWVVDPVDGTTNFVHSFPLHATSIAYCENKSPVLGVVYCPMTNELFSAERGKGAWLNGRRLRTSSVTDLGHALVSTGFNVGLQRKVQAAQAAGAAEDPKMTELFKRIRANTNFLIDNCQDVRRIGACSLDLAYTAAGRLDGFSEIGPHEWDFAAGVLLLTEAGGCALGFQEKPFDIAGGEIVCAGTETLARALSAALHGMPP